MEINELDKQIEELEKKKKFLEFLKIIKQKNIKYIFFGLRRDSMGFITLKSKYGLALFIDSEMRKLSMKLNNKIKKEFIQFLKDNEIKNIKIDGVNIESCKEE